MINPNDNIHDGLEKLALVKKVVSRVKKSPTLAGLKSVAKGNKMTQEQAHRLIKIPGAKRLNKSKTLRKLFPLKPVPMVNKRTIRLPSGREISPYPTRRVSKKYIVTLPGGREISMTKFTPTGKYL